MQSTPMASSSSHSPHLLRSPQRIASTNAHTEFRRRATIASSAKFEVIAGGIKEEEILESNCWRSDHRTLRAEIRGLRSGGGPITKARFFGGPRASEVGGWGFEGFEVGQ